MSLLEDRDSTIWAGSSGTSAGAGGLCAIRSGTTRCYGQDCSLGQGVYSLLQGRAGDFWIGASLEIWRWSPEPPEHYPVPHSTASLVIKDLSLVSITQFDLK